MFRKTSSLIVLTLVALVALLALSSLAGAAVGSGRSNEKLRVASPAGPAEGPEDVPGELIVTFKYGVSKAKAASTLVAQGGKQKGSIRGGLVRLIKVEPRQREESRRQLLADPAVARVELNHVVRAAGFPQDAAPNDTYYSYQWNFPQIRIPDAWKISNGAGVTVAVVDSGVAYENYGPYIKLPDLAGTSFAPGYDFVNNDDHPNDDESHGTHVAGTIAQTTNNGSGEAGIAYGATIMPVKVLDASGKGTDFGVIQGILFAADNGADIINLSLGSTKESQTEKNAIDYALGKNVLVVAAGGNLGNSTPFYPAAYPGVIAVGAVRYDRARSYYSNYGSWLDIVAPGGDLRVDQNGDTYADGILQQTFAGPDLSPPRPSVPTDVGNYFFQGTSMASPHIAGVAALMMSAGTTDTAAVAQILTETADDLGAEGRDDFYGSGEVNAAAAVTRASGFKTFLFTMPSWPNGSNNWFKSPTTVQLIRSQSSGTTYYKWDSMPSPIVVTASTATFSAQEGVHTLSYYSLNSLNETETPMPDPVTIMVDTHAPTVPVLSAPNYSTDKSKNGSFPLSWTPASDTSSGVRSYDIQMWDRNTSATGYKLWKRVPAATTVATFTGRPGHSYWFRVRARDNAGNYSAWSNADRTMVPYDYTVVSGSGFGGTVTNLASSYYMGTIRYSRRAGDWVSFTTTTKRLTLIATGGNRSKVKIYIDGRYIKVVDPSATTGGYHKALYSYAWSRVGRHTIKVVNLATRGRAQFDVDGFAAER